MTGSRLRIVICSRLYAPGIGGLERVMQILAGEFTRLGHEVTVVTSTPAPSEPAAGDRAHIERNPSLRRTISLLARAELALHAGVSLRYVPLSLLFAPRTAIIHHTWLDHLRGAGSARVALLRQLTRGAVNIGVSRALTASLPPGSHCIPNPYDAPLFPPPGAQLPRDRDLLFVGRLVSDKGADLLIQALGDLKRRGITPTLTIVGEGPERGALEALVRSQELGAQVEMRGPIEGGSLAEVYTRHRVTVIPSRWREPFGLVALEALASGCGVIGSNQGGLPEAIGGCGALFDNGNCSALAQSIERALAEPAFARREDSDIGAHLAAHAPGVIADRYLRLFFEVTRRA